MKVIIKFQITRELCAFDKCKAIYIAGDRLRYRLGLRFLSNSEIKSRDPSLSLCNVKSSERFCIVQSSHQVWNPNLTGYPSPSPAM